MEQYIPKSAVVAEIKNLIERAEAERVLYPKTIRAAKNYLLIEDYKKLFSFIDTLEVKEEDLNEYINKYFKGWYVDLTDQGNILHTPDGNAGLMSVKEVAKHFFELGIKAQKL